MNAPTKANFSFSRVWDDTLQMLRANAGLLSALAGVFLFLPSVLFLHFVAPPEAAQTPPEMLEQTLAWWQSNWPWLALNLLVNMVGLIAIYLLLLGSSRMTVGAAVMAALPILPFYFAMWTVYSLAFFVGLMLLIVPGIYLLGRLSLASPVLVTEMSRAPFGALERSWALTRGRGWQIAALIALVYLAALLVIRAIEWSTGAIILLLLGPEGVGGLLLAIIASALGAAAQVVVTVLIAAIYRALTLQPGVAEQFS